MYVGDTWQFMNCCYFDARRTGEILRDDTSRMNPSTTHPLPRTTDEFPEFEPGTSLTGIRAEDLLKNAQPLGYCAFCLIE